MVVEARVRVCGLGARGLVVERHAKPRAGVAREGVRVAKRGRRGEKGVEVAKRGVWKWPH